MTSCAAQLYVALLLVSSSAAPVVRTLVLQVSADSRGPATSALVQIAIDMVNADERYNASLNLELVSVVSGPTPMQSLAVIGQACSSANVSSVIGPPSSSEAVVIGAWASIVGVPIVAYSATAPSLGNSMAFPNLLRVVLDDASTLQATLSLLRSVNVTHAAIIAQDDAFGLEGLSTFQAASAAAGVTVLAANTFPASNCSDVGRALGKTLLSDARYIVLWAFRACTDTVLVSAAKAGLVGPRYVWLLSAETTIAVGGNLSSSGLFDGTLVVQTATAAQAPTGDAVLRTKILQSYAAHYPTLAVETPPVYAFYAADAVFLLASALAAMPANFSGGHAQRGVFDRVMSAESTATFVNQVRASACTLWSARSCTRKLFHF